MIIEFNVVVDLYNQPDPETGEMKPVKKNIIIRKGFNLNDCTYEQYLDSKGKILKSYTTLITNGTPYKVKHNIDYVANKLQPNKVTGFYRYTKKFKKSK